MAAAAVAAAAPQHCPVPEPLLVMLSPQPMVSGQHHACGAHWLLHLLLPQVRLVLHHLHDPLLHLQAVVVDYSACAVAQTPAAPLSPPPAAAVALLVDVTPAAPPPAAAAAVALLVSGSDRQHPCLAANHHQLSPHQQTCPGLAAVH
jgi:hypothetical protein